MAKLPDLEAWGVFAKVASSGSFSKAAKELSLSNATVSKLISRLEARLGERLFHRTSRKLTLTETGRVLATRAAQILSEGEDAEAEAQARSVSPRGRVRLAAPMSFGLRQIAPLLPEFLALYPEVSIDLRLDDRLVDLIGDGVDIAVRIAALADSSLIVRKLCPVERYVVGTPAYFEKHGRPRRPSDLSQHACLPYTYLASGDVWYFVNDAGEKESVRVEGPLSANSADALEIGLRAGLGLAMQPDFVVWDEIESGGLERVLQDWPVPPLNVNVLTPAGGPRASRVTALIEFLVQHFSTNAVPWAKLQRRR
ncbi:MAG: LysR family transcriptional regulator [Alphaproteobacteria bacterium]|nr:LysR family transcriptional regulator [Alphaproteobacteria bacterium]MDE2111274.1 LysR family transcriptional regulator [Alphaproteobacteria bacterium]MDE2492286.1 LysR family transcriptional regulator [Alphaproteobacteria bacterium]